MCWDGVSGDPSSTVLLAQCPPNYRHYWVTPPPSNLTAGHSALVSWELQIDFVSSVVPDSNGFTMPHSNLHSCVSTVPFCTPSSTGDLVTTTPAIKTQIDPSGLMVFEANLTLNLPENRTNTPTVFTTIAHTYLLVEELVEGVPVVFRRDIAIGLLTTVRPDETETTLDEWAMILFYVLAGIALGVTVLFLILVLALHSNKVIRYSSPLFLSIMAIGAIIALVSIFFLGTTTDATCVLREWFFGFGYVMLFGALFAKTFRIYKLFANSEYKVIAIYNWQLLVAVFVLEVILIIILAVWTAEPFRPSPTKSFASNGIEYVIKCDGDSYDVFVGVVSAYYLVLAVIGLMLAFLTRNIHTLFNESVWIGYSCFCLIVVAVITPIQFLIDSDPTPVFVLRAVGILISIFFTVLFMFVPKLYRVAKGGVVDLDTMRSGSQGTSMVGGTSLGGYDVNDRAWLRKGRIRKKVLSDFRGLVTEGSALVKKHDTGEEISSSDTTRLSSHFKSLAKIVFRSTDDGDEE